MSPRYHAVVWCLMVGLALLSAVPGFAATPLTLVHDGQPAAVIVLGEEASKSARFGAAELQWHVKQMTGAELPIVREGEPRPAGAVSVYIGDTTRTRKIGLSQTMFREQEYAVKVMDNELFLVGKDKPDTGDMKVVYEIERLSENAGWPLLFDEQGSLYAVYEFLEGACGVRWLNPYPTGILLPQSKTLVAQVTEVTRTPQFIWRDSSLLTDQGIRPATYNYFAGLVKPGTPAYQAYERLALPELDVLYPRTDPAKAKTEQAAYDRAKIVLMNFFLKRLRVGGKRLNCNHSLYSYYERFREATWTEYLANAKTPAQTAYYTKRKADVFEADHPDWFAQGYGPGKPPQLCYTNPEVIQQVAQDARDYFDGKKTGAQLGFGYAQPPAPFPLEAMDNRSYCKCERCAKVPRTPHKYYSSGADSDNWFSFVNEVAKELRKTHPDARIRTLAYMSHAGKPSFPLEPNVEVQFCAVCADSPLYDPWSSSEHELFLEWGEEIKQSGREFSLWTYTNCGVTDYEKGERNYAYPGFMAHNLARQWERWREFKVQGLFLCGWYAEPDQYVMWHLFFDGRRDVDKLLKEYFTGLYGAAGVPLKAMYDDIESRRYDESLYPPGKLIVDCYWTDWGTAERMEAWGKLMAEARALAKTEREKRNVAIFEAGPWAFLQEARKSQEEREASPIHSLTVPRVPAAGGDLAKVDWAKAAELPGPWHMQGSASPTQRSYVGRLAHDGENLYLETIETVDTSQLVVSPQLAPYDDYEIFVAKQRARPYRQYLSGPKGATAALAYGEAEATLHLDVGFRVESDTSAKDKWRQRMVFPLATLVAGGVKPGDTLYMNITRVISPAVCGERPYQVDSWVSHSALHKVDRLAEVKLAP